MTGDAQTTSDPVPRSSVELPRPTAWPIVLAFGIALVGLGAATSLAFVAVGGIVFVVGLIGWIANLMPGRGHEQEAVDLATTQIQARLGTVGQLKPGAVGYRFQLPQKVQPISAGVKGGILGGLLMPIPAIAWGIASGHGPFFPINLLVGMIVPGLTNMPQKDLVAWLESFHFWTFLLGFAVHAIMSVGFGLVGGVLLPTLPTIPGGPMLFGGLILPLSWTAASYGLMGVANPLLDTYIDWKWYVVSQLVYGITASIVILRTEKIPIAPRGKGTGVPPGTAVLLLSATTLLLSGCSDALPGKPDPNEGFRMPQTILDFSVLYGKHCAGCHGADGMLGGGPPLNDPLYLAIVSDRELESVIASGRKGTLMPAWSVESGGPLTKEQVTAVVKGLKQSWAKSEAGAEDAPALAAADAGDASAGREVYQRACAVCHGAHGEGGDAGKINDSAFLALTSDRELRRYCITGRADLGMPDYQQKTSRGRNFKPLTNKDIGNLMAFMTSWRSGSSTQ
jgi:mono/diheme cytochrome c family protein